MLHTYIYIYISPTTIKNLMVFPKFRGWSSPNDRGENLDGQPIHDGCMTMPNITHVAHVARPWHICAPPSYVCGFFGPSHDI